MYQDNDYDFRIVKKTRCKFNNHVWIYTGNTSKPGIPGGTHCDCGLYVWDAKKQEGIPTKNLRNEEATE